MIIQSPKTLFLMTAYYPLIWKNHNLFTQSLGLSFLVYCEKCSMSMFADQPLATSLIISLR